ncbi:hypothetical protein [Pectobacterium versatile]|uniref:hypothetical protein n=1 Tax=Pectobacterium versatile TaxID=2488639 RepID=UPI001CF56501|nr:hypothetical protein [Pectobacterium versatile]MCA6924665.1 hypothetical protein [Pectobacterium versatile]MCH5081429.1 hypothetical protein [Pectobacterium versatile]
MYLQTVKTKENRSRAIANSVAKNKSVGRQGFVDNRLIERIYSSGESVDTLQRFPSIIQLFSNDDLIQATHSAKEIESLAIQEVISWRKKIQEWMREVSLYDPRQRHLENLYHIFSRQELAREQNRLNLMTRIIAPEQLARPNIGINSVRRSDRSLKRNLNGRLVPQGNGKENVKRLYSFMRKFGGAGLQGFHNNPMRRLDVIYNILNRMAQHRGSTASRGPKFAIVAVDRRQLAQENVLDTTNPSVRQLFLNAYGRFQKMYQQHADEGVVAVKGNVDKAAIKGLRAFRGVPSKKLLKKIMELLLDLASAEPEPTFNKFKKRDNEDDQSGPDGTSGGVSV